LIDLITSIGHIGIIGSGKMGADIFSALTVYDYKMVWLCINHEEAEKQNEAFLKKLNRQLKCGAIDQTELQKKQESVIITDSPDDLSDCDLVIECIWENLAKKKELFKRIEPYLSKHCIIASNSSSFIPSLLIPDSLMNDRFIGLHFFYPVKLKNIVEIIKTEYTSQTTLNLITKLCDQIGKKFLLQEEKYAFILNKLFLEVQNEAFKIYSEGILSYQQIDNIVQNNLFPDGIFKFFDQVGIDVMLQSIKNYSEKNIKPYEQLLGKLEEMQSKHLLGIKTRQGFYNYNGENQSNAIKEIPGFEKVVLGRLKNVYFTKAQQIVADQICDEQLLDFAAKEYMNTDKGPFAFAHENLNR